VVYITRVCVRCVRGCVCVCVCWYKISDNWFFNKLPEACVISEFSELIPGRDGSAERDDFSSLLTYTNKHNVKSALGKKTTKKRSYNKNL